MEKLTQEAAYKILQVDRNASDAEIKSAYKKLALKTHPDKNPHDPKATTSFLQVTEAYRILSEPDSEDDDSYPDSDSEDDYDDDEEEEFMRFMAFRMFEKMFGKSGGNSGNGGNGFFGNGPDDYDDSGPCDCPNCRQRRSQNDFEEFEPKKEYIPKSQR